MINNFIQYNKPIFKMQTKKEGFLPPRLLLWRYLVNRFSTSSQFARFHQFSINFARSFL